MPRRAAVALLLALTCVLGACGAAASPIVDTWPVGAVSACGDAQRCDGLVRVGLEGLDARDPGHAAVVSTELHDEGVLVNPSTGHPVMMARSGGVWVLVIRHADGTTRAIGVGYPGISKEPVATPWETASGG